MHPAAAAAAGKNMQLPPPPPPPNEQMSATYIPQGDTYGEGVGIPGLGGIDDIAAYSAATTQRSLWGQTNDSNSTQLTTPLDDASIRDRAYAAAKSSNNNNNRAPSTASTANAIALSSIPPELVAQWPIDKVLLWLQVNNFSKDWQETFKSLGLQHAQFLGLGFGHGGRGNFGMMHQQVYPRLARECINSGTGWDQQGQREEGKRMRRLVRNIVEPYRTTDPAKLSTSHSRKESVSGGQNTLQSAGTDPADSPNVSLLFPPSRDWHHRSCCCSTYALYAVWATCG